MESALVDPSVLTGGTSNKDNFGSKCNLLYPTARSATPSATPQLDLHLKNLGPQLSILTHTLTPESLQLQTPTKIKLPTNTEKPLTLTPETTNPAQTLTPQRLSP